MNVHVVLSSMINIFPKISYPLIPPLPISYLKNEALMLEKFFQIVVSFILSKRLTKACLGVLPKQQRDSGLTNMLVI